MRLLFDQNLSPRLVQLLADLYPNSSHVPDVALGQAEDRDVWTFAQEHGFAIVSKDGDFRQGSFLLGAPPKVIWVRLGNRTTRDIETALRSSRVQLQEFDSSEEATLLTIG